MDRDKIAVVPLVIFLSCICTFAQKKSSNHGFPGGIIVGRHSFIDVGPPNDFYEIFIVRQAGKGSSVERLTVTPAGDACIQPPTVERATAKLDSSIWDLLHGKNPCLIPQKEITQELKRCKNCLRFSGADIVVQVECGQTTRRMRMDVLERDWFDPSANTPKNTSRTMGLLSRLDKALGTGGVMQRPIFSLSTVSSTHAHSEALEDLRAGSFDSLFAGAPDRPSELFAEAQEPPPVPSISILSVSPILPINRKIPKYPPIARAAHVEGTVTFELLVASHGKASKVIALSGPKMLIGSVIQTVSGWKFPEDAIGKTIHGAINFRMNCTIRTSNSAR